MLLAAQSMAVGTILVRYVSKYADPIMATGYHMLLGGIPLAVLSAQREAADLADRLPMINGKHQLLPNCRFASTKDCHSRRSMQARLLIIGFPFSFHG